jgi:hypothetical protein
MSDLAAYRTALRRMLGDAWDDAGAWDDGLLDAGLRDGLRVFGWSGPVREASVTVTAGGHEIDISAVGVMRVYSVAWPWTSDSGYDALVRAFRMVDGETVRLDGVLLSAGEVMRFRYAPVHTIKDLDGATTTTVLDAEESGFLYVAAAGVLEIRARRLQATPSAPDGEVSALLALADQWRDRGLSMVAGGGLLAVADQTWAGLGL